MFALQRDRSKVFEVAVANWLQTSRNYFILPAYDYSGLANNKAPRMMRGRHGLVLPDLFGAQCGKTAWFEVKVKEHADLYRKTQTRVTGLALRHWRDYQEVKAQTGSPVWIIFVHEAENAVLTGEIDTLKAFVSHTYEGGKMDRGGTIFFVYEKLSRVMNTSDLRKYAD